VPYLFWTIAFFLWNCVFQTFPEGFSPRRAGDIVRWFVGLNGWQTHPGGFGLWYVKSLMFASLLAPCYWAIYRCLGPASVLVGVFLVFRPPLPLDHPLFNAWFFLGGCISYHGFQWGKMTARMHVLLPLSLAGFTILAVCHSFLIRVPAFLTVVPYIVAGSLYSFVCKGDTHLPQWLTASIRASSYLYFSHVFTAKAILPLLYVLIPLTKNGEYAALAYVVRVCATVVLALFQFLVLRKFMPRFLSMMTGNRC
jgi:hypothetical protein